MQALWLPDQLVNESPPPPPRRLLLIANPISGGGKGRRRAAELGSALRQLGIEAEVHFTTAAGDGAARAARAGSEGWHGLVAIGGDGTVNEVLNGMPDPSQPLGVLPVGTANVLAMELHLPKRPGPAAAVLAAGHTRTMAIGMCGDRRFLLFCGAGLDGAVVERLSKVRTGTLGKHRWLGPILHTAWHWPQFSLRATFADGRCLEGLSSVLVTRVRNYGGILHLTPDVSASSGMLHVLCFRQRSRLGWLWQGLRGVFHRMRAGRQIEVRATTAVHIEGDAPFQLDGDFGGHSPVRVTLLPAPARIFAPK